MKGNCSSRDQEDGQEGQGETKALSRFWGGRYYYVLHGHGLGRWLSSDDALVAVFAVVGRWGVLSSVLFLLLFFFLPVLSFFFISALPGVIVLEGMDETRLSNIEERKGIKPIQGRGLRYRG